jgi:hypothetical protein
MNIDLDVIEKELLGPNFWKEPKIRKPFKSLKSMYEILKKAPKVYK